VSLKALLDAVAERIPDGIPVLIGGAEEVSKQGAPPRVVLQFISEQIEAPHGQASGAARSRWLCTRAVDVDIHIWGKNLLATEELAELVLNVLQELAPGDSHRRRGVRWVHNAFSQRGFAYVLSVTLCLPVERRQSFATLEELPTTGEFEHPET